MPKNNIIPQNLPKYKQSGFSFNYEKDLKLKINKRGRGWPIFFTWNRID